MEYSMHRFLKEVLDASETGFVLLNSEARVLLWNDWMEVTSSIPLELAYGTRLEDIFPDLEGTRITRVVSDAIEHGNAAYVTRSLNKVMFPLYSFNKIENRREKIEQSIIVKPIESGGEERHCLIQIVDITATVQREIVLKELAAEAEIARKSAENLSRLKSDFISTVSHELRTPLISIRGSIGLMASGVMGEFPKDAKNLLDIACNNTERLMFLINDILDMEKIESGKMDFIMGPLDLTSLIEHAVEVNTPYGEQHQVSFVIGEAAPDIIVSADTDRLMQVFSNLMSNAAKFSPKGSDVVISTRRQGNKARVSVKDNGPGIPEDFRDRIFQKFTQADSSNVRQIGGTGLGLSISKAMMEHMGGGIGFSTELGVGTDFYIDLCIVNSSAMEQESG